MENPVLITPEFAEYELIDSGGFEKLERFGRTVTIRPEPQAIWQKSLPESQWNSLAGAVFRRTAPGKTRGGDQSRGLADERGSWELRPGTPEQ